MSPPQPGPLAGSLLGTAVGDALGLPRENLSPRRAAKWYGPTLRHRFLLGRGMTSDDTEHASMVAQALLVSRGDPDAFARALAWRLRGWFLLLPAGVGFATLRACLKLCLGFGPARSGVFSAGNGPAMRAPLLGVALHDDLELLRAFVRASSRLTHTDPLAEEGAYVVARAAAASARQAQNDDPIDPDAFLAAVLPEISGKELRAALEAVGAHVRRGDDAAAFAEAQGWSTRGVSGYVNHTVPAVIFCWLRHQDDPAEGLRRLIALGGDADTTGAILGGILGARLGVAGWPPGWTEGLWEYPRSRAWLERLGTSLEPVLGQGRPADHGWDLARAPRLRWWALPLRNALFLGVVLAHGLRRLLPPY